jgi:hypothetical protein
VQILRDCKFFSDLIIAAPITLPTIVVTVAGYLTVAGGVMTTVAQAILSFCCHAEKNLINCRTFRGEKFVMRRIWVIFTANNAENE